MITVTKQENGVLFTFENSDKYLYGSGTIEVPFNSLSIIQDESDMITLRKSASNDIFLAARYDTDLGYSSKEEAVEALKGMLYDEAGISEEEVQDMIDAATSGIPSSQVVEQLRTDVDTISGEVDTKQDELLLYVENVEGVTQSVTIDTQGDEGYNSGLYLISNDGQGYSELYANNPTTEDGSINTLVAVGDDNSDVALYATEYDENNNVVNDTVLRVKPTGVTINDERVLTELDGNEIWYTIDEKEEVIASALTEVRQDVADIDAKEEVIASALTEVRQNKQDALQYYSEDTEEGYADILIRNDNGEGSIEDNHFDIGGGTAEIGIYNEYDDGQGNVTSNNTSIYADQIMVTLQAGITENGDTTSTELMVEATGVTINGERVLTESDGVYYINFATLTTKGIHDADWDGMVNAINAHRPIYAGLGGRYYTAECLYQNGGNQIIMTASDELAHFFYTFTKNGSENYSFSYETKPYTTQAEKDAWNAKQDALSAGTGIEISGNVISATGGGGATYSAGSGIAIDTANTISVSEPIHAFGHNVMISESTYNPFKSNTSSSFGVGSSHNFKNIIRKSVAFGESNTVNSDDCLAQGSYVTVNNIYEAGFGRRNNSVTGSTESGQTLFSVGNGTSSANHNAFEIRHNGDIYFPDTDNTTYANYYQKPMVRLQDMYAALGGLKLVQCTQAEYDALVSGGTVDSSTIYFITNVVS